MLLLLSAAHLLDLMSCESLCTTLQRWSPLPLHSTAHRRIKNDINLGSFLMLLRLSQMVCRELDEEMAEECAVTARTRTCDSGLHPNRSQPAVFEVAHSINRWEDSVDRTYVSCSVCISKHQNPYSTIAYCLKHILIGEMLYSREKDLLIGFSPSS